MQEKKIKTYLMTDASGYIKIGQSVNVKKRWRALMCANPTIHIIAVCDENVELELHHLYKPYQIHNEWYGLSQKQIEEIINFWHFHKV